MVHVGGMKTLRSFAFLTGLLAMAMPYSTAASQDNSFQIDLNARVPVQCGIGNLAASGSAVRVPTACNSRSFTLEFSGVPDLRISNASAIQNVSEAISVSQDSVFVSTSRPGGQIVDIAFDNSPQELSGLIVSIGAY